MNTAVRSVTLLAAVTLWLALLLQPVDAQQNQCDLDKTSLDPFIHKRTYNIGVYADHGLNAAFEETNKLFGAYLTATAGRKFDPPIEFNVEPYFFHGLFDAIEHEEMDLFYANPGIYSCIGTQIGATALATVIDRLDVRGRTFELDVYGGVIAVRHDNDGINSIADLKGKIIGAGAIVDLMGGQMQFYEMARAGLSYVNDPKQVVFTKDQSAVVRGVLSGRFDVGFVRTNRIELIEDEEGNLVDPDLFKIIEPNIYVMDDGDLFPFLHSTDIFAEWPFAALPSVPNDVQQAIQDALMDLRDHASIGKVINECTGKNSSEYCDLLNPADLVPNAPCGASRELGLLAVDAEAVSHITGFRTAKSYFELRSMQQAAGFIVQDEDDKWYCTRPTDLYEAITCPDGYFKRSEYEFLNGCEHVGLHCNDNDNYDCFCEPCVKAYEVDVYHLLDGQQDPHLEHDFGDSFPGCEKMSICGTIEQGESITLRIFDNVQREGAQVEVVTHAGNERKSLSVTNIDGTHAYEFRLWDDIVHVHVIDILVDGEPISQSPVRVVVEDKNCEAVHGVGSHLEPDKNGNCICAGHTYEMGGTCLESAYFFLIIFAGVSVVLGVLVFAFLGYKKKQSDSVWHINVEELHFNEPPEIIGQGGFGVVILGQYRGTKVAVKRVLPPAKTSKNTSGSGSLTPSRRSDDGASREVEPVGVEPKKEEASNKMEKAKSKNVKFGEDSGDVESQTISKSSSLQLRGSFSGSNTDWERLLTMNHSGNDVLKILESATTSDHGSNGILYGSVASTSGRITRCLPLWLRFDEHTRRVIEFTNEMRLLSRLRHPCITTVMGAVVSPTVDPMLVMEYMEYGSLHDLLNNETMTPGGEIILQVVRDVVQGIQFLHASKPPILHGDLKAKNILVDSRFRAKVADFGFSHIKTTKQRNILQGTPFYMAPEYLRRRTEYTSACDIYAFAMIIYEIYARQSPFEGEDPRKVLPKVCHPRLNKRPVIPASCPPKMVELMKKCWSSNAFFRPSAKDIDYVLVEMSSRDTDPLETDHDKIREQMKRSKPTSLYDVFPKHVADALNAGKKVEAEAHEIVTIVFSDIVGFTTISQRFSPMKVSSMLDRLYNAFDDLANKHHIFKVETVGDAYMGVTNLEANEFDTHVKQAAEYAQDAIRAAGQILVDEEDPSLGHVQIRVGMHSGAVVSNVIGSLNPRYGLFGDTVNTASRMESNSMPGRIHCSHTSAELLKTQAPDIPISLRGMIKVKGKGKMKTFWVGDEEWMKPLVPNPAHIVPADPIEPEAEREGDDTFPDHRNEEYDHYDLSENEDTDPSSSSHGDHSSGGNNKQSPTKVHIVGKPDELSVSHRTSDTHVISRTSESEASNERDHRDHFIKVHCSSDNTKRCQSKIQMDGTVDKVVSTNDD